MTDTSQAVSKNALIVDAVSEWWVAYHHLTLTYALLMAAGEETAASVAKEALQWMDEANPRMSKPMDRVIGGDKDA